LVAASVEAAPAWPLREEVYAVADARSTEQLASVVRVRSGSAGADWLLDEWVRDDCSVVLLADDQSVLVARLDEGPQAGWAADGSAALQEGG